MQSSDIQGGADFHFKLSRTLGFGSPLLADPYSVALLEPDSPSESLPRAPLLSEFAIQTLSPEPTKSLHSGLLEARWQGTDEPCEVRLKPDVHNDELTGEDSLVSLPDEVLADARLAAANSFRECLEHLDDDSERMFFANIFGSERFAAFFLACSARDFLEIGVEDLFPGGSPPVDYKDAQVVARINQVLLDLSVRVHVEHALPFARMVYEPSTAAFHWAYDFKLKKYASPRIATAANLKSFSKLVRSSSAEKGVCKTKFAKNISDLVILTHNRNGVVETIKEVVANLKRYGHEHVTVHVFDDSNDARLAQRRKEIFGSVEAKTACVDGIELRYFGKEEKQQKLRVYQDAIAHHKVSKKAYPDFDRDEAKQVLNSSLMTEGGAGSNRNWAQIEFGNNVIVLDDDVLPRTLVKTGLGSEGEWIPVDLVSVHARALEVGSLSACARYSNLVDSTYVSKLGNWAALNLRLGSVRDYNPLVGKDSAYSFTGFLDPAGEIRSTDFYPCAYPFSGGAVSFASAKHGLLARLPFQAGFYEFRVEDTTFGDLMDLATTSLDSRENPVCHQIPAGLHHNNRASEEKLSHSFAASFDEVIGRTFQRVMTKVCEEISRDFVSEEGSASDRGQSSEDGRRAKYFYSLGSGVLALLADQGFRDLIYNSLALDRKIVPLIDLAERMSAVTAQRRAHGLDELADIERDEFLAGYREFLGPFLDDQLKEDREGFYLQIDPYKKAAYLLGKMQDYIQGRIFSAMSSYAKSIKYWPIFLQVSDKISGSGSPGKTTKKRRK